MESKAYNLYRGSTLLGTVEPKDELHDFPWYGGAFEPSPAFARVEHLFREEQRLLEADDMEAWESVWLQIEEPGLRLVPTEGGAPISDLLIHISGAEVRWRY
jgi:hypothetical protein